MVDGGRSKNLITPFHSLSHGGGDQTEQPRKKAKGASYLEEEGEEEEGREGREEEEESSTK